MTISFLNKSVKVVIPIAQSICTQYSCFEDMGQYVTLKKIRSIFWTWFFFLIPDPKKISGRPDKLEKWVQIDWTSVYIKLYFPINM